jgi:hypothetical protein
MKSLLICAAAATLTTAALAGPYAPAAGQAGSDAVDATSSLIHGWATGVVAFAPGPQDISVGSSPPADYGVAANALGPSDASTSDPGPIVSLGDGGSIKLSFATPITNGPGADFAVFENGFSDTFLELAFVSVSSDGTHFIPFPSHSLTPASPQIGTFGTLDPTNIDGLAGKYRAGFGTPFDLALLSGVSPFLDVNRVTEVKIIDVVGSIDPQYGTRDSAGNLINDPWTTAFPSGGFDLDAVGVLNQVPEPATTLLLGSGAVFLVARRRS